MDLTKQPTLFLVPYAHLDTEWRWEYPQVIDEYLTKTMRNNFALFDKYPHYVFNFTGSNRYGMMKEYFPEDYARLKQYVAAGRWFPAGSSVEESDINSPSAESIFRQILYGNAFFRDEFGIASQEYMLPDCFGFPASLPSILAHAGIKGFSTQKLSSTWQPAPRVGGPDSPEKTPEGIPFNVGVWQGPDGRTVIAALNPSSYGSQVYTDLSKNNDPPAGAQTGYVWDWPERVNLDGKVTGLFADFHYVGTGDTGGSPTENSVRLMEAIQTHGTTTLPAIPPANGSRSPQSGTQKGPEVKVGDGPLHVVMSTADEMFRNIKADETGRMPRYKGDLELINHSAGSLTSQAYQKRWNRENEVLGDAAEKASVMAAWLGGPVYPQERLNRAWRLILGGQFHDIMAGTATPKSYEYAWNDSILAMNQFAGVLTTATEAVASAMNTEGQGVPIVVFNSLNIEREDVVEADVHFLAGAPTSVRVIGPDGKEVPSQLISGDSNPPGSSAISRVLFLAKAPSVGYAVYDLQPASGSADARSELSVSGSSLENGHYRLKLDENGDVASIFDKQLNRELLSAPIRLAIITDKPHDWPAWNMDFEDEQRAPRAFVSGPAKVRIVERGPVRVALEVSRVSEGSRFVQTIRLSAGDAGHRVEFANAIDWKTKEGNLKALFPFSAANRNATYNWDVGTIERPNEDERQFEVATHQWMDLTDQSGAYGVTVLTEKKYGSDKSSDNTLRLTLIRTPGIGAGNGKNYSDQTTQDWGHHEFVYGIAAHDGDWRKGQTDWQAYRLDSPMSVFETRRHFGALGKSFSLLKVSNPRVRVLALKKAERSNDVIVRVVEISGQTQSDVHIGFARPIASAREVNAQEQTVGTATVRNGEVITTLSAWQPQTFAVELGAAPAKAIPVTSQPVALTYDASVATLHGKAGDGCFDCSLNAQNAPQGNALPAEMLPHEITFGSIRFKLAPAGDRRADAVTALGQSISLPAGHFSRVYLLAASYQPQANFQGSARHSSTADIPAVFNADDKSTELEIENWTGYIGQWDNRIFEEREQEEPFTRFPNANAPAPPAGAPRTRIAKTLDFTGAITPGFVKRADVGWFASHRHSAHGSNEAYAYAYLFVYPIELANGAKTLTLPDNDHIRVLAVSVANEPAPLQAAHPLYDMLEHTLPADMRETKVAGAAE